MKPSFMQGAERGNLQLPANLLFPHPASARPAWGATTLLQFHPDLFLTPGWQIAWVCGLTPPILQTAPGTNIPDMFACRIGSAYGSEEVQICISQDNTTPAIFSA